MNINLFAVGLAAVAQFVVGAIWYMPIFGNMWGQIHGFEKLSKAQQAEAQKQMLPLLTVQFVGTVVTTVVLAKLINMLPNYSVYSLATLLWLGFMVPVQVSAVLFGGTEAKWLIKKSLIMAGGALACILVGAAILTALQ